MIVNNVIKPMDKQEIIEFLEKLKPYINLNSLCKAYNNANTDQIDYNNLRMIINRKSCNRVSEVKLKKLYNFIYQYLLNHIFEMQIINKDYKEKIYSIIDKAYVEVKKEIQSELFNDVNDN